MPADSILVDSLFDSALVNRVAKDDLVRLSTYTLACVHHKGFLSPELLSTLSPLVDDMPLTSVNQERVYPPVLRFGPTLNDFARDGQLDPGYWEASALARAEWTAARLPCDPFEVCLDWLGRVWGSSPEAALIGGHPLLAGTIRKSAGGLRVHFDEVAREFPHGLFDQKVVAQLALNVYLAVPPIGGETTIWRHTWEPIDEAARIGYGYEELVVEDVQSITVRPEAGDALLFNPRLYHKVAPSGDAARVSVAMFLGITVDGAIVVWS
jgi:hypothetical protein